MSGKKITDLQLRDNVSDEVNFPSDDGIQSYRVTGAQLKSFILPDEAVTRAKILEAERVPVGAVFSFAGSTVPEGYLLCNGAQISRSTYSALFSAIGTAHGNGDGSTTFNLPDYRGRFLRGRANGSGLDPDRASRIAMATGGATGDNVGSVQGWATKRIQGKVQFRTSAAGTNLVYFSPDGPFSGSLVSSGGTDSLAHGGSRTQRHELNFDSNVTTPQTNRQATNNETRPVNAYANFIIKF